MTLHTDGIAAVGREFCRINDGASGGVRGPWSVTTFATDSRLRKQGHLVAILGAFDGRTNAADVTVEARRQSGKVHGSFGGVSVTRRHVPNAPVGTPVHRRLEDEAVDGKEVGAAAATLSDVVEELAFAAHQGIARALEAEPDFSALGVDAIVHA